MADETRWEQAEAGGSGPRLCASQPASQSSSSADAIVQNEVKYYGLLLPREERRLGGADIRAKKAAYVPQGIWGV